jgi:triosephosphate isomerase
MPEPRQTFIVANWKMHTTASEAETLASGIVQGFHFSDQVEVIVCPPFPYLQLVGGLLKGSGIALGAQNMYPDGEGWILGANTSFLATANADTSSMNPTCLSTRRWCAPSLQDCM